MRGKAMNDKYEMPVVTYTKDQLTHGIERAGGRCELSTNDGERCTLPATSHALFLLWVNAGEPPMDNFVAACGKHAEKHAKSVSLLRSIRIVRNRQEYFPHGESLGPVKIVEVILSED
jgi:hypothetical protein